MGRSRGTIEGHVLQQLGGLWRWLQDQSPAKQAVIFAAPVVAAAILVLGGLVVWSVASPIIRPGPTVVVQANPTSPASAPPPTSTGPANKPTTNLASSPAVVQKPTVVIPPTP